MGEEPSMYTNSSGQAQFRLKIINKIKDCFITEIREKEAMSKGISKCIATFDYFDKALIVLSETSDGVSIVSFANVIGTP